MQRSPADGDSAQRNRLQQRHRRQRPGAAHLHLNLMNPCHRLARGVLVGNGPSRSLRRGAHLRLQGDGVHLDHHAVNLIGQRLALGFPLLAELQGLLDIPAVPPVGIHLEAQRRKSSQRLPVLRKRRACIDQQAVAEEVQAALGHDARLQHADGTGGGVAGIGKLRQTLPLSLRVDPLERLAAEDHLAAHFQVRPQFGLRQSRAIQRKRQRADRARILRHLLSHRSVASRDGPAQQDPLVEDRHAHAVHLQLGDILHPVLARAFANPAVELKQLLL